MSYEEFRFPLGEGKIAILHVPYPMSQQSYDILVKILELCKDGLCSPLPEDE